jgi:hypothetical protein
LNAAAIARKRVCIVKAVILRNRRKRLQTIERL